MTPLILLTNDDGFYSPGIEALYAQLNNLGQVYIVAPDRERSASSLSLTLHQPLRIKKIRKNIFAIDGTPVDCIYIAVQELLPKKPDLLISGINQGPNLGQQDISYSGTVAGALQGTFLQIPSLAASLMPDDKSYYDFEKAAEIVLDIAQNILEKGLPQGITLNINIPAPPNKGIKISKLGEKRYNPEIISKSDPRSRTYYWIGTGTPTSIGDVDSDVKIIKEGFISITPLHRDLTEFALLKDQKFQELFSNISNETLKKTV
jgi:5'-nucleotidase